MITPVLPTYARYDLAFERGEGAYLFDADDRRYLDFGGGIAVNALGHAHPALVAALKAQADKLWHVSNLYHIPEQERLAKRLVENSFADTVFFANSGAEAVECALKMARKYHAAKGADRYRVITFKGSFHGRTLATISAAHNEKHTAGFEPVMDGFDNVPLGDIAAVRAAINENTAAILIEPVLGEGGIMPVDHAFQRSLREIADEFDLLLIYDEVQSGMGRTGKLFACEWADVTPDIMTLAKGLGGGFPIGACLATEAAAAGMVAGSHGSTFGGNPLAVAVGNAVLDVVLEEDFLAHVRDTANYLRQELVSLIDRHPDVIEDVRGEGLMIGLKCRAVNGDLIAALHDRGLLTVPAADNVVRLLPPLIIGEAEIREAVSLIDQACCDVEQATNKAAD